MLKVCHITSAHPRYDIRIFVKECVTLAKNGYAVSLVVADILNDEVKDGVHIYNVGKENGRFKRMLAVPKKIYAKVLQLKPDVVHFHDPELMFIGRKLAKRGIKVVYDVHEDLPKQVQSKHWLPKFTRPLIAKLVAYFERTMSGKFYGIIAATPIIARRFATYNPNSITLCNYPLLSELHVSDTNWQQRENSVCYIGSISRTRGIVPIVLSLQQSQLHLKLAGSLSGDIMLSELLELPGGNYIDYLGVIGRDRVAQLLQEVKIGLVTLLPTPSYIESLPIKMFEYMLAGIPVIASNFPLWVEIIERYDCGLLVNPNDPEAIATACTRLINDDQLAQTMGENGKKAVLEHFNWEQESKQLVKFYLSI